MGAWIEILPSLIISEDGARRTPRWVRGLKSLIKLFIAIVIVCRTPRWVRGLKF